MGYYNYLKDLESDLIRGKNKVDILLLDIQIGEIDGLEICREIKNRFPEIRIIILSNYTQKNFILKALKNGAHGYMVKNITKENLIEGLNAVMKDELYLHEKIKKIFLLEKKKSKFENQIHLTKREKEVLLLIAEGLTTSMIAKKLFISVNTVETHRASLLFKTGSKNSVELLKIAYAKGLIDY